MGQRNSLTGLVLAGGASTRFGSDKAHALFAGETLFARVCTALAAACDEVIAVAGPGRELPPVPIPLRTVADDHPGAGPLAGLITGMKAAAGRSVFAAACDLPLLDATTITAIASALESTAAAAAVPRIEGRLQPLAAAYSIAACRGPFEAAFTAGERSLQGALRSITLVELEVHGPMALALRQANTPAELRTLADAIRDISGSGLAGRG
jgi:molybdopterin-guanine dinucleotide biosynthesis protein A